MRQVTGRSGEPAARADGQIRQLEGPALQRDGLVAQDGRADAADVQARGREATWEGDGAALLRQLAGRLDARANDDQGV